MAADFYSIIEEKGYDEGTAFIVTHSGSVIEIHLYGGIILFLKSLRMSLEQIYDALSGGDIKEVTFRKSEVKPETAQAKIIAHTFPAAVTASAIDPARAQIPRILRIVRLMSILAKSGGEDGIKTYDTMSQQISKFYPGFLPDIATMKNRTSKVGSEFGLSTKFLDNKPFPSDIRMIPEWVLTNFEAVSDSMVKEMALYYILFGEHLKKVVKTTIEQETSLGAKQGFGILSKMVYPDLAHNTTAVIYKGTEKVGSLKIDWQANKKSTFLLTKTDLEKLKLQNGTEVTLSLEA